MSLLNNVCMILRGAALDITISRKKQGSYMKKMM